jgi:hypothetical protein
MDNVNLKRDLEKIHDVVQKVQAHLYHKDAMNANLHMTDQVRSTPLYSAVEGARLDLVRIIGELDGQG